MVDEHEIKGAAREFGGKVQDTLGAMTGDAKSRAEGTWNEAAGTAQKTFGATRETVTRTMRGNPLAALAAVAGAAFLLGFWVRK